MNKNLPLLDKKEILKYISKDNVSSLLAIDIKTVTASTNDDAKEYLSQVEKIQPPLAIFAEEQTSGRGRGNKKWISPYGKNIYCSLAWTTDLKPHDLDGLSLCVAVVITNCLKKITSKKLAIKWPNDLFVSNKKFGGILIETVYLKKGCTGIIIGVGLNLRMSVTEGEDIDQDWSSLFNEDERINRNKIAGLMLNSIIELISKFKKDFFKFYIAQYEKLDILQGRECSALNNNRLLKGMIKGVNEKGELILKENNKTYYLRSGEVSLNLN